MPSSTKGSTARRSAASASRTRSTTTTKNIRVENVIIDGPSDKAGRARPTIRSARSTTSRCKDIIAGDAALDVQQNAHPEAAARRSGHARCKLAIVRGERRSIRSRSRARRSSRRACSPRCCPATSATRSSPCSVRAPAANSTPRSTASQAQGAKAYVLDLRYNGGGYLNAAVDVSSKFIPTGPIVTVKSRAGTEHRVRRGEHAIAPRPLAVLVNAYTASASEITAGAIQDSGVGTLVGTKTFGKGVVQTIFPMRDGSAVKITTARYFTPNGHDINSGRHPARDRERDAEGRTKIRFRRSGLGSADHRRAQVPRRPRSPRLRGERSPPGSARRPGSALLPRRRRFLRRPVLVGRRSRPGAFRRAGRLFRAAPGRCSRRPSSPGP